MPGSCLPVDSCPVLKSLAESPNRNSEIILYLKNSICGFNGMVPKLCCPLDSTSTPVTSNPPPPNRGPEAAAIATPTPLPKPLPTPLPTPLPPRNGNADEPVDVSLSPRLSLLPLNVCGIADEGKIIGGKKAKVFEYPWMAVLGYFSSGWFVFIFRLKTFLNCDISPI